MIQIKHALAFLIMLLLWLPISVFAEDEPVPEKDINNISVFALPKKTEYVVGEKLELSGGRFEIQYTNNTFDTLALSRAYVYGFDSTKVSDKQWLYVKYKQAIDSFYITIKGINEISVFKPPHKTEYVVGEELELAGGRFQIQYTNNTFDTLALSKAKVYGFDSTKVSDKQWLYVEYQHARDSFYITIAEPVNPYTAPAINDSYYQISTADELLWFMTDVNNGDVTANAVLTQDIVLNEDCLNRVGNVNKTTKAAPVLTEWQPIGSAIRPFRGSFDGQGHTISGLYINNDSQDNSGFFGVASVDAVIKNVGVVDSYISGNENVGAICGKSEGTIANCYSTSIVSGAKNVGGVVGVIEEEAVVCNSYNLGSVTSEDGQSAGVCNTASTNAVVENCYYLAEEPVTNDPQAKTAEQFKSGEVAELLSQDVEINGVVYTNENVSANTEIPGMEEIEQRNNLTTPVAQVANKDNNIKVWSNHRSIFIETLPNTKYTIIDINGRLITASTTKSTHEEIRVNYNGIAVVIINGSSFKVYVQ